MKKLFVILLVAILSLSLVACGGTKQENQGANAGQGKTEAITLVVGATAVPHAEILEKIKPTLEKEGVKLDVKVFQDYVQPNIQLSEGQLDANFFQHVPYLESFTKERNITNLVNIAKVHVEPMGIYSKKVKNLNEVPQGAKVSIPNDPSNMGRSLVLLQKAGLIKLKDGVGIKGTVSDIVENQKNLEIVPLDAAMLPRSLEDVTLSVINTNYALQAKLNPVKDSLFIEDKDSPYANVLVVRKGDENKEAIQKLVKALNSEEVRKFIEEKYNGAVVPAF
ncbi:MetQ/NlpA family ABC transporter substrate-binding protein [Tepidibacillus fermentans]|uniref:Lipoprotein n=1 Tax=Tepidibacillus fermentans TaxID=1281767 RepID=A0A4R3K8P1_9BACI|nr:MetQ/NlpA family ABC transporter substrate-binding protein [Tepidibacillus fermentans]TCS79384.1 D-methionine transport system substrate-binding protein [Tepidibacillus fermentans]